MNKLKMVVVTMLLTLALMSVADAREPSRYQVWLINAEPTFMIVLRFPFGLCYDNWRRVECPDSPL